MHSLCPDYLFDGKKFIKKPLLEVDRDGKVLRVADFAENRPDVRKVKGVLSPGFINSHLHLELSGLAGKVERKTGLPGFITRLQQVRGSQENNDTVFHAEQEMWASGTVAAADISNTGTSIEVKKNSSIKWHTLVELFGFAENSADPVFQKGLTIKKEFIDAGLSVSLTPHAPYSVSLSLFNKIVAASTDTGFISIHNQEHASEDNFLTEQKGSLAEMLQSFGLNPAEASLQGKPFPELLSEILPLNLKALLVHNTFTSPATLKAVGENKSLAWCFCPRANLFIENRLPSIPAFYEAGLKIVFGTDSLASNDSLDLFEEIKVAKSHFPELPVECLLGSITSVPAGFWGFEGLGSMVAGTRPGLVKIDGLDPERNTISGEATAFRFDLAEY